MTREKRRPAVLAEDEDGADTDERGVTLHGLASCGCPGCLRAPDGECAADGATPVTVVLRAGQHALPLCAPCHQRLLAARERTPASAPALEYLWGAPTTEPVAPAPAPTPEQVVRHLVDAILQRALFTAAEHGDEVPDLHVLRRRSGRRRRRRQRPAASATRATQSALELLA
jgi:hypothetical protein